MRAAPRQWRRVVICLALLGSGAMARIVDHLSPEELEARYRAARDVTEARHTQAIWLLAQGRTCLEVAEVLAFVPRWVQELAARYNALGPEALGGQRRRNGRAAASDESRAGRPGRAGADTAQGWRALEWLQGRCLDGAAPWPGTGAPTARLGSAATDQLVAPGAAAAATASGNTGAAGCLQEGSMPLSLKPGRRIPTARSRSGRRTS